MVAVITFVFITVCGMQMANGASPNKKDEYIPIKYPGKIKEVSNRNNIDDDGIPEQCRGQNYCTIKPSDYPDARFNEVFKGYTGIPQPSLVVNALGDRTGDDIDNCESEVTNKEIYHVKDNREGRWHLVVQAPQHNIVQKVRLETCKEGSKCFQEVFDKTNDVVQTYCKQKSSVWEFTILDENNKTEKVTSELPTCCSCQYKRTFLTDMV